MHICKYQSLEVYGVRFSTVSRHDCDEHGAAQAAAADGKREAELPPTLKLMQQNTRLVVLTLEVRLGAGRAAYAVSRL